MQLPLSASALVPVGAGAVLAGVLLILVILSARRRRPAGGGVIGAPEPVRSAGPNVIGPQVAEIDARLLPEPVGDPARRDPAPGAVPDPPDEPTAGATGATGTGPDTAAGMPFPGTAEPTTGPAVRVAGTGDRRSAAEPSAVPQRPAPARMSVDRRAAGSAGSVAAAVAQAFAVRAAASGAGVPVPTWGINGARRPQEPDVPRGESPASDRSANGDRSHDRDSGTPVTREQPQRQVPERAAAPSPHGGPEHPAEPETAAGVNDGRDATGPRARGPGSMPRPPDPGPADRSVRKPGTRGAEPAAAASSGFAARTDGRGAVSPHSERVPAGTARPQPWARDGATARSGSDARDRLLAVLLADPVHAVGATEELVRCLRALECLTDAVRHEREVLGDVLRRLADDGLCSEQLARLAGMALVEVEALLAAVRQQPQ